MSHAFLFAMYIEFNEALDLLLLNATPGEEVIMRRFILIFTQLVIGFGLAEQSFGDQCRAYCAIMHRSFSERHLFSSDTTYFKLDYDPYKVEASSYVGLQRLCPSGYLLTDYKKVHVSPAMMGMGSMIDDGIYLKDVVGYNADACMPTVREAPPQYQEQALPPGSVTTQQ